METVWINLHLDSSFQKGRSSLSLSQNESEVKRQEILSSILPSALYPPSFTHPHLLFLPLIDVLPHPSSDLLFIHPMTKSMGEMTKMRREKWSRNYILVLYGSHSRNWICLTQSFLLLSLETFNERKIRRDEIENKFWRGEKRFVKMEVEGKSGDGWWWLFHFIISLIKSILRILPIKSSSSLWFYEIFGLRAPCNNENGSAYWEIWILEKKWDRIWSILKLKRIGTWKWLFSSCKNMMRRGSEKRGFGFQNLNASYQKPPSGNITHILPWTFGRFILQYLVKTLAAFLFETVSEREIEWVVENCPEGESTASSCSTRGEVTVLGPSSI